MEPIHWQLEFGCDIAALRAALPDGHRLRAGRARRSRERLLDTHDRTLHAAGLSLWLDTQGRLRLIDGGEEIVERARRRSPRRLADLPPALRAHKRLAKATGLWGLAPLSAQDLEVTPLTVMDGIGKTVLRLTLLEPPLSGPVFLSFFPLRGYGPSAQAVMHGWAALCQERLAASPRAVLAATGPAPEGPPPLPALAPEMPAAIAVQALAVALFERARHYEAGVVADPDTECLHQYRVNLRKLRSLIRLLKSELPGGLASELNARLRALARATGAQRDLDVFLLAEQAYRAMLPAQFQDGLAGMFAALRRERRRAHRALMEGLQAPEYAAECEVIDAALGRLAAEPDIGRDAIARVAAAKLRRRYRKVARRAAAIGAGTPDTEIHALRIEGKKLRYLLEFFRELRPPAASKPALKKLKALQDGLGEFNDLSVQQRFLEDFLARRRRSEGMLAAVSALIAVLHQRQRQCRDELVAALAAFTQAGTAKAFDSLAAEFEESA